jgi:hypothetical protein
VAWIATLALICPVFAQAASSPLAPAISKKCQERSGVSPGALEAFRSDPSALSLFRWQGDGVIGNWGSEQTPIWTSLPSSPCSASEVAALGALIEDHRMKLLQSLVRRLHPQLEYIAKTRPPNDELARLKAIADSARIPLESLLSPLTIQKWTRKGNEAARLREASCTEVVPQTIAPNLDMHQARRQSRGWCFAFASADLLSAKLGKQVSAFSLATSYFQDGTLTPEGARPSEFGINLTETLSSKFKSTGFLEQEGGFPGRLLGTALDRGQVCSEASSPSEIQKPHHAPGLQNTLAPGTLESAFDQNVEELEGMHAELELLLERELDRSGVQREPNPLGLDLPRSTPLSGIEPDGLNTWSLAREAVCSDETFQDALKTLFPRINVREFVDIALQSGKADLIRNLAEKNCESIPIAAGRFSRKGMNSELNPFTSDSDDSAARLMKELDEQLSKGNPVVAGYTAEALIDPSRARRTMKREKISNNVTNVDHASLIVGRTWDPESKACLYAIKNSWGRECDGISDAFLCDEGIHYVKADQLHDMIYMLDWLEETQADRPKR